MVFFCQKYVDYGKELPDRIPERNYNANYLSFIIELIRTQNTFFLRYHFLY